MEKIASSKNINHIILLGCCALYQEKQDPNILKTFSKYNDIEDISNLIKFSFVIFKDNGKEIVNIHYTKFLCILNENNLYYLLGKKENGIKTIFTYNEIPKNILDLPNEILDKIFIGSKNKSVPLINRKFYDAYIEDVRKDKFYSYDKIENYAIVNKLLIKGNGTNLGESNKLQRLSNCVNVDEITLIDVNELNYKFYSFMLSLKKLKTVNIYFSKTYSDKFLLSNIFFKIIDYFLQIENLSIEFEDSEFYLNFLINKFKNLKTLKLLFRFESFDNFFENNNFDSLELFHRDYLMISRVTTKSLILRNYIKLPNVINQAMFTKFKDEENLTLINFWDFDFSMLNIKNTLTVNYRDTVKFSGVCYGNKIICYDCRDIEGFKRKFIFKNYVFLNR
jgi:hypothetical protein